MNGLVDRLACLELAETILEKEFARTGTDPSTSARALSLATTIQDAIEAWQVGTGDRERRGGVMSRADKAGVWRAHSMLRELDSYRNAIREAFDEGFALSKLGGPIEMAWERSEARQTDGAFAHTRISVSAGVRALFAACRAARNWVGLDGDGISDPTRAQLIAAIAQAEGQEP